MTALTVNLRPTIDLTDHQFYQLCQHNPELRFERTATGELVIMSPTGGETGKRNFSLSGQLWNWTEQTGLGVGFDSSTGFKLPNGADRSPDAAWVLNDRWNALTPSQKEGFAPIAPDFVVELRSKTDSLATLEAKMQEYLENGVRLGWLLDPQTPQAKIYRPGQPVETISSPDRLTGEDVLPGFVLDVMRVFR
ncbi:MAG: Uma2 family endonuclease [Leptolyngbyaceae cyanobacterium CSU_1_3]|nr:Uma2 family endonuclease [Leptolyngbyaceae cyanobacterium CSU_1_3]